MFSASKTAGPSGYNLTNSLRFRASASAYLNRTPASAGNRQIMTYSFWIKRGAITGDYNLTNATTDASNSATFYFNSSNNQTFDVFLRVGGTNYSVTTSQLFRDPSAWYHIIVAIDTTQATASNRTKVYVNGSQVTNFLTANYVPQNSNLALNNNVAQYIGFSSYFDGYMDEINFIDGQALTPSSFGSTNSTTGVWQPARYSGTYGTNGFYLNFTDIALTSGSNAGLGKDFSGNGNYWNTNNISVTAGTTYDAMSDVPTLTSATVANYCVLNPINLSTSSSTSNANLRFTNSNGGQSWRSVGSTIAPTSGKWYWEGVFSGASGSGGGGIYAMVGVFNPNNYFITNYTASLFVDIGYGYYGDDGNKKILGATTSYGATFTNGDIIGLALDLDSGTLTCYKNNVSQGVLVSGLSGPLTPAFAIYDNNATVTANFGQRPFTYTPPTGFVRLNTYNLPDSTIKKGNTVMDATTYTGNGSSLAVTNSGSMKPDFLWIKGRSGATDHQLLDTVRGANGVLVSNTTAAETVYGAAQVAFNTNGFTVGGLSTMNTASATYVGWQWQAGQGSTSSNTSGTITSTVSVSTTAGFSVVTWTANGVNGATVGHGLGVAPKMIIVKSRSNAQIWPVYHASIGNTGYLALNSTAATTTNIGMWNNTSPTSTVFTTGDSGFLWGNGFTYVAYCWAEIAGFSKFGSYTGNFNADGPFIYTGFRPKFVLLKSSGDTGSWNLLDATRNPANVANARLFPNNSNAEATSTFIDFLSNGFKIRTSDSDINYTVTNIYMAFAENPFKNALAR